MIKRFSLPEKAERQLVLHSLSLDTLYNWFTKLQMSQAWEDAITQRLENPVQSPYKIHATPADPDITVVNQVDHCSGITIGTMLPLLNMRIFTGMLPKLLFSKCPSLITQIHCHCGKMTKNIHLVSNARSGTLSSDDSHGVYSFSNHGATQIMVQLL